MFAHACLCLDQTMIREFSGARGAAVGHGRRDARAGAATLTATRRMAGRLIMIPLETSSGTG